MEAAEIDIGALWQAALASSAGGGRGGGEDGDGPSASPELDAAARAIKTLDDLAAYIEASGQAFSQFRSEHRRLWEALRSFVGPVATVARIATTPASVADFGVASSAVLGAVAYLVRACEGVSNAYDWIEHVFRGEMQEFADRLAQYLSTPAVVDAVLQRKIVAILAAIYRLIRRGDHLVRRGRFRQYLHVAFLGKDVETRELVDALNRELGGEHRYTVALTLAATQRIEDTARTTHDAVEQLGADVRELGVGAKDATDAATRADEDARLKRVLCSTPAYDDVEELYARNARALLKGTGAWLETEPFFGSWAARRAAILWIFGGPGAGKTYLSTWIVKGLLEQSEDKRAAAPVAYFFVKEDNENLRDANVILKTLAWQIAQQDAVFRKHAAVVCERRILTITAEDTWQNLFLDYYASDAGDGRAAAVVVDGLDEATAETRRTLLRLLKDLVTSRGGARRAKLQFAIIGRPSLRGDGDFKRLEKSFVIEVSRLKNKQDIDQYIKKRLEDVQVLWEMRKLKPDGLKKANKFGSSILKKVSDGADGVFLWAKLLLDNLVNKDQRQIESILVSPPSTLDDMIWSVYNRLAKDDDLDTDTVRKMLLLAAYSRRPLLFAEMYAAISLPARTPNYLLWKQTRGVLSSVFELKFPGGVDPDDDTVEADGEDEGEKSEGTVEETDDDDEDDVPFDFSGGGDDDDDGDDASEAETTDNASDFDFPSHAQSVSGRSDTTPSSGGSDADGGDAGTENGTADTDHSADQQQQPAAADFLDSLSEGQCRTEVTFGHAWMRDYLVREGNPRKRRKPPQDVTPAADDAQAELTLACLELFKLEPHELEGREFLGDYALCHMPFHLEAVDRREVPRDKAVRILEGLYWLFGTDRGTRCLVKAARDYDEFRDYKDTFWELWVETDHYLRLLQAWFNEADALKAHADWPEPMVAWMNSAAASMADLLRPVMVTASKMWLVKSSFDSVEVVDKGEFPAWLMHGWVTWLETGATSPLLQEFQWITHSHAFELLTPERLEHIANWAGLSHDVFWHTCLGWMLMNGEHYAPAESHYQSAIALFPGAWVALEGLARCAGEQGRTEEAMRWQRQALDALTPGVADMAGYLWPRISEWAEELGDHETGYEAARMGWEANDMSIPALERYLAALNARAEWCRVVDVLRALTERYTADYDLLTRFFVSSDRAYAVGDACRRAGRPRFVVDAMDRARRLVLERTGEHTQLWQAQWMGRFKYTFYGLEAEATDLLEFFLDTLRRQSPGLQAAYDDDRKEASSLLAQLYFDGMVTAWRASPGKRPPQADKLKKMAVAVATGSAADDDQDGGYDGFDLFQENYPAMLWGRWLKDYLGADAAVWRKCFRVRLLDDMNRLDDTDPTNDTDALSRLAPSLFHAGDRRNAAAILAILFKAVEERPKSVVEEGGEEEEEKGEDEDEEGEGEGEDEEGGDAAGGEQADEDAAESTDVDEGHVVEGVDPMAEEKSTGEVGAKDEAKPLGGEDAGKDAEATKVADEEAANHADEVDTDTVASVPPKRESADVGESTGNDEAPPAAEAAPTSADPASAADASSPAVDTTRPTATMHKDLWLNVDGDVGHGYQCDNCGRTAPDAAEMWFCEVCFNINWCDDCLALLREDDEGEGDGEGVDGVEGEGVPEEGEGGSKKKGGGRASMRKHACNPAHDFYRAWPVPDDARYVAAVSFEHGVTVRKAWLAALRTDWLDGNIS